MKTSKDKAMGLVKKFKDEISYTGGYDDEYTRDAIECAKIAVEEIITTIKYDYMRVQDRRQTVDYWEEVKNELNKM